MPLNVKLDSDGILSPTIDARQAFEIIQALLLNPDLASIGIKAGLKYLRQRTNRFGKDTDTDHLALEVAKATNSFVDENLRNSTTGRLDQELASAVKEILDGYRERSKSYGNSYAADRCVCLFNLAEILRKRNRSADCIKLLKECEILSQSSIIEARIKLPSTPIIQACLSEILLLNGETVPAQKKSRAAIKVFRSNVLSLTRGDWVAYGQVLVIYWKACRRLKEADEIRSVLEAARRDLDVCPFPTIFRPALDRIEVEEDLPTISRRIVGPEVSYTRLPSTCRSEHVIVSSRPTCADATIQTEVADIGQPTDDIPQFVPPAVTPRQHVQAHRHDGEDWVKCISSSTGKDYFYNTRSGVSCWTKP